MKDLLRLLKLFKPYLGWLVLGMMVSFVTLLANVALMAISGWFITAMAIAGVAGVTMNYFTPAAMIRAAAIVRTAGRYGERLITHEATFRLLAELRVWFYQKLEPLAPAILETYRSGDLLSRIRTDIDALDNVYLRLLVPVLVALLASILFVIFLFLYNPLLALIEFTLLLLAGVFVPWLVNRMGHQTGEQMIQTSSTMRAALVNDLQGMGELLVYAADESHASKIKHLSQQLASQQQHMSRISGISQGTLGLSANLAMLLILITAIPLVSNNELPPPSLAMLALFALASFEAVMPLPMAFQTLGETLTAARRIFSIADSQAAIQEPGAPFVVPENLQFTFRQVYFRYQEDQPDVLRHLELQIKPGGKLAIIGASGSGKSTLISLLLRFRDATSGEILLNSHALQQYNSNELRQRIAVVAQHNHLFNTSIRENLLLANQNASQNDIEQVCKTTLLHDFIIDQPEAYETVIGETGVRLSGGQIQRLAIARALLKPASLLILDEPTEGLDPQTATTVMNNIHCWLEQNRQGLLLITHSLQGLEPMDQILVLESGEIKESGRHDELIKKDGVYRRLRDNYLTLKI